MCKVIVAADFPHSIIWVEGPLELLGRNQHEIKHQPLEVLTGPKTDRLLLNNAIKRACGSNTPSQFQVVLYELSGQCRNFQVSCSRHVSEQVSGQGCLICLEVPNSVLLDEVYQDNSCAWALASAEWPHRMQIGRASCRERVCQYV